MWEVTHNPWYILQTISRTRLEEAANDREFVELLEAHVTARHEILSAPTWFEQTYPKTAGALEAQEISNTPERGHSVPAGRHRYSARFPGHLPESRTVLWAPPQRLPLAHSVRMPTQQGIRPERALPILQRGIGHSRGATFSRLRATWAYPFGVGLLWQRVTSAKPSTHMRTNESIPSTTRANSP
jgi:hypothetical protein